LERKRPASTFSVSSRQSRFDEGDSHVQITIVEAKELTPADKRGTSDPFIKVYKVGTSKNSIFKTKVVKKTLNPVWKDEIFNVSPSNSLKLIVMDKNNITSDIELGYVQISLAAILGENETFDQWFPIQGGSGSIHVKGELTMVSAVTNPKKGLLSKLKK
jgi:Ca2+-dependent lipid-binding protein